MKPAPGVGVIVPVLNEAATINACLQDLLKNHSDLSEIIIVDGGSTDGTLDVLSNYAANDQVILVKTGAGRALQMNAGARCSQSDVLLFLHADTCLPAQAADLVRQAVIRGAEWGRFNVALDDQRFSFRAIESLMNLRSCITGICTGDHAMFVRRDVFNVMDGYKPVPIMEDIEFSQRLNEFGKPACIQHRVTTSARRWQQAGIVHTILLMWWLRLLYWVGRSPESLVRLYKQVR